MATILVVDDSAVHRQFLAMLLGYAGHRVVEAADGGAALEMLRQVRPDLVISDIVMPEMDGVEFARRVRADAESAPIPIIFYTASYRLGDAAGMAQSCGVSTVITKPSKPQLILDIVAAALAVPAAPSAKPPTLAESLPVAEQDLNLSLRLSMLIELGLELTAQRDPQQLLELACRGAHDIFAVHYAAVGIVDAAAGRLSAFAARGLADGADAGFASLDPHGGILGAVLKDGKPRRLQDLAGDAAASGLPAGHPPVASLLVVPLASATRAYGWLYMAHRHSPRFSEADEQLAVTLAAKLALAYENLLLLDSLQRYTAVVAADADAIKRLNADLAQQAKALQLSETRFRLAMDASKAFAYMLDCDLRFTWAHGARMSEPTAHIGKTAFDLLTDESARALTALYRRVMDTRAGLRTDIAVRYRMQPDVVWHRDLVITPQIEAADEVTGLMCVAVDITPRKEVEKRLGDARDAAEQASLTKSRFLANMSHEIRTPLHIISGIGHLLYRDFADTSLQARIDQLCATSDHLLALLNDILDLSKIEADMLVLDHSDFGLAGVVDRVLAVIAEPARDKGLALTTDMAPALRECALRGDSLRLAQILINLLSNAVKFTDRGTVGLAIAARAEDARAVTLRFTVADTGIGIAAVDQARLFQAFTQMDDSATRNRGGSGLGLAISQRLAMLMGSEIEVDSEPGVGSRFAFELTLPRAAAVPATAAAATDLRGVRVLLAEDHPLSQDILFEMLGDLGCDIEVASDGAEAVECARRQRYDLILMDMQMPKMDGLAATRAIRALPGHHHTPIIALTASAFAEDRRHCFEAGMNGHIGKPVTPATLAAALGQWLPDLSVPEYEPQARNHEDHELRRALAAIPGLDAACADQFADYVVQLDRFVHHHGEDMARLREHLAADDHDAARVIAHQLTGIAGLLGARRLSSLAHDIVQGLRAGADTSIIENRAALCEAELADLTAAIKTLPARPPASAAP